MPAAFDLTSYSDVRAVFEAATRNGFPMQYALPSAQQAARWRFRAYSFRKRTLVEDYKSIVLRIRPEEPHIVVIDTEDIGVLTDSNGRILDLQQEVKESEAEEVRNLRKELGLD